MGGGGSVGSHFKVAISLITEVRATASEITTGLGEKIVLATTSLDFEVWTLKL